MLFRFHPNFAVYLFTTILFLAVISSLARASDARRTNLVDCQNLLEDPTVASIARSIDALADTLRAKGQLLSPVDWRRESASFGLPGLDLPEALGGQNFSASRMATIFEYTARHGLDLRDVVGAAHGRLLARSTHPDVLDVARRVAHGEGYIAVSITEEGAGADFKAMKSYSERVEGGFRLTGAKLFNARLSNASHVVILARAPRGEKGFTFFLVPLNDPGLTITDIEAHGLHGNSFGGMTFNQLFVPASRVVGEQSKGEEAFKSHFLYWRLMMAAAGIGTGKGALAQVPDRLNTRMVRGAPLADKTHLQQPLSEFAFRLHLAHLGVQQAAKALDDGELELANVLIAGLKAEGVEVALAAADYAMRVFGAEGYSGRVDLGRRASDLIGLRIADGPTDVMRDMFFRMLFAVDAPKLPIREPDLMIAGLAAPESLMLAGAAFPFPPAGAGVELWPDREAIIGQLQEKVETETLTLALAQQGDFDFLIREGRGGACPTVNAFNQLQILREYDEPSSSLSPHAVIREAFVEMPELHEGRLTNEQLTRLMHYFKKKYLRFLEFDFHVNAAPAHLGGLADPKPNQILGYIFDMYTEEGVHLGRHFTTLKSKRGIHIVLVEPQATQRDYEYVLQMGTGNRRNRIELVSPKSKKYTRLLESVITIDLE